MSDDLWNRLSTESRAEVDRLIGIKRNVEAIALMRERAGEPAPHIHKCLDLLERRRDTLR
ncbi:hypothetical protein I5Q34_13555 [Streptomyces sp. AV19]|uniref:hypothetical protein n=1 Tax=Streptomyces sp. AV19 TaxID=2793068 RepID=UPI0018FE0CDD|nr:hypothetical protein [Streptomyces sp. AV19]MBH1935286.1 hypothetical protein [Streptomyces sp. AV19]MDG4531172.1 hypothetical protein [Streptomyces sp. AV19]